MNISPLQTVRYQFAPTLPAVLQNNIESIGIEYGEQTDSVENQTKMKELFPNTYGRPTVKFTNGKSSHRDEPVNIGVVLSGGQAPGGHNVIAGIYDAMKAANSKSKLYGFLNGPAGILENRLIEITGQYVEQYRNTGGFDMIGSGRTKLETEAQFATTAEVCKQNSISAIVIIGGDYSNTNAAVLAEYYRKQQIDISVIGVPKTIDGDLKNEQVEVSFGCDTATKTYAELIGNIQRDANSAKKYWHFIKLMGRSASHIALECALQTQPNVCIIGEEVAEKQQTLGQIVQSIVDIVVRRSEN